MRTLLSWISVTCVSLFAQVLTFVLSGIGLGYGFGALQMYKLKKAEMARDLFGDAVGGKQFEDVVTGLNDADWLGLKEAVLAMDIDAAVTQMPILGWYFLTGFLIGGTLSVLVINVATIYHLRRLAQGGQAMAEKLGALPLDPTTAGGMLSKAPQIVGDLADDFGIPAPALYLLSGEEGMNAFVVGRRRDQSVMVLTSGLRHMSRRQLKGIVAHELAHIRGGDMVHNMRLLAIELGINSVRHTAEWMLRNGPKMMFGSSNHRGAFATLQWGFFLSVLGIALWPMGLISSLVGSAIMAMTNRKREMRADRLAAKVLGSWEPVGDALKRILGHDVHGRIAGPDGRKLGHLMFAQANGNSGGLLDTHPKLQRRIKKADRRWDGVPVYESEDQQASSRQSGDDMSMMRTLAEVPAQTMELFVDPKAAMLTVPALLLFREQHRALASSIMDGKLSGPIESLWAMVADISDEEWFAMLELTLRHVRTGKDATVLETLRQIQNVAPKDAWELQCWLAIFADAYVDKKKTARVSHKNFRALFAESLQVISIGVSVGSQGLGELRFQRMWGLTGLGPVGLMEIDPFDMDDLEQATAKLNAVPRKLREGLAEGFAQGLLSRNHMAAPEAAFLKYICLRWDVDTKSSIAMGSRNPH